VTTLLVLLRVTLLAVIIFACLALWHRSGLPLTSSYGRSYWTIAVLTSVLGQLPYGVALIRIWKRPDREGLSLAVAAGTAQVVATFWAEFENHAAYLHPWPWLRALLGSPWLDLPASGGGDRPGCGKLTPVS
jgi:hypothetical protein